MSINRSQEPITTFCFLIEDAVRYGAEEAIFLYNIRYWVRTNKANESSIHLKEGRYWTWNSKRAFTDIFPFWSERQLDRIVDKLKNKGAILVGEFNKVRYDRTKWYTVNDDSSKSLPPKCEMHLPEAPHPGTEAGQPIPNINLSNVTPNVTDPTARPLSDKREFKEDQKEKIQPLVKGLDNEELESLAQLKYLDDHDQGFLADIVDVPGEKLTKKQLNKLEKIRKRAINGRKIEKLRPSNPDDIAWEEKRKLEMERHLGQLNSFSDEELWDKALALVEYSISPGPNESAENFRKRCAIEIRLQYA